MRTPVTTPDTPRLTRYLAALALVATLLAAPVAQGASGPEKLWDAFPLDPTAVDGGGVTLSTPEPLPSAPEPDDVRAAPAAPEPVGASDGTNPVLAVVGGILVAIVVVGVVVAMRTRRARRSQKLTAAAPAEVSTAPPAPTAPAPVHAPASTHQPQHVASTAKPQPAARPPQEVRDPGLRGMYGPAGALQFVSGLSDEVLERATIFFDLLRSRPLVESSELADALGVQPRELPGILLTPLSRRAAALEVRPPYEIGRSAETSRRAWRDAGRVADNLLEAIETIQDARASTRKSAKSSSARA